MLAKLFSGSYNARALLKTLFSTWGKRCIWYRVKKTQNLLGLIRMKQDRRKIIKCYVNEKDFLTIKAYARQANQTLTAYGRQQMLVHNHVDLSNLEEARALRDLGILLREHVRSHGRSSQEYLNTLTIIEQKLMEKRRCE